MNIFNEQSLDHACTQLVSQVKAEIEAQPKEQIVSVDEAEFVDYLVDKYCIEPLEIAWDKMTVSERDVRVKAGGGVNHHARLVPVTHRKQAVVYHIPFTGDGWLLGAQPSRRIVWTMDVSVSGNEFEFQVVNWSNDSAAIKKECEDSKTKITEQLGHVNREVDQFNQSLRGEATTAFANRKQKLIGESNLLESLGVPVRKVSGVPETFTVPAIQKRTIVKPVVATTNGKIEPAISAEVYGEIVEVCHDLGVEMERHPSLYEGKDENSLRDNFLLMLTPQFQSVTGETFNKRGKTDILIRHDNSNLFVGECKFWTGPSGFHETIDQILSYLTWRDSKAAILNFVPNKELNPVLEKLAPAASGHPCYVASEPDRCEGWSNFKFHLPGDSSRTVHMAVLSFHFPAAAS